MWLTKTSSGIAKPSIALLIVTSIVALCASAKPVTQSQVGPLPSVAARSSLPPRTIPTAGIAENLDLPPALIPTPEPLRLSRLPEFQPPEIIPAPTRSLREISRRTPERAGAATSQASVSTPIVTPLSPTVYPVAWGSEPPVSALLVTVEPHLSPLPRYEFAPPLSPGYQPELVPHEYGEPSFEEIIEGTIYDPFRFRRIHLCSDFNDPCSPWGRFRNLFSPANRCCSDGGLGQERVGQALFEMDTTQPQNNYRFRFQSIYNFTQPDRSSYLWSRTSALGGRGPVLHPEPNIDYQEFHMLIETGGDKFSMLTNIPIRVVDPVLNGNSAGLGDMDVATKTVMLDGETWQITQIFRTYFSTGSPSKGLGNGHTSLEPGFLFRYKWDDSTYLHGEIKYWFPLGANPLHGGQVLRWGIGMSNVWYENDVFAVMPTVEYVSLTFLDGQSTTAVGTAVDVDGDYTSTLHIGLRFAAETGGDLGLFELGVSGVFDYGTVDYHDGMLRIDLRWIY